MKRHGRRLKRGDFARRKMLDRFPVRPILAKDPQFLRFVYGFQRVMQVECRMYEKNQPCGTVRNGRNHSFV